MLKLDRDKIEAALVRGGISLKRSKSLAGHLVCEDLLVEVEEPQPDKKIKTRTRSIKEVETDIKEE